MTTKVKQDHMIPLPLLFLFKDEVTSKDFPAKIEVETRGRVLSLLDGGKVWMYGVQPGAIAASGNDRKEAAAAFRAAYKAVLLDIAEGGDGFVRVRGTGPRVLQPSLRATRSGVVAGRREG